jgi:hypothetical protein
LYKVAEKVKNFAVIYLVDISQVPDFNKMYELYDPCTCMFFYRNKHIMIDLGTGNNNKINWALEDTQEFIDIVETVYRGARKGKVPDDTNSSTDFNEILKEFSEIHQFIRKVKKGITFLVIVLWICFGQYVQYGHFDIKKCCQNARILAVLLILDTRKLFQKYDNMIYGQEINSALGFFSVIDFAF